MTNTEETPLLASDAAVKHNELYSKFSQSKKRGITALASFCAFIPLFASGSFIPSIAEIAHDLNTTPAVVSLSVSLSFVAGCLGALSGSTYSTYYGRRPVYLASLPLLALGSLGTALSRTVPQVMFFRFLQSLGGSPGMSVGAGVIGDIYKLEERGTAMGLLFAAMCLAPALAPPIGGLVSQYYSWRVLQLGIGATGIVSFLLISFFYPETSHPGTRGIDKAKPGSSKLVLINPLRPLQLLRSPNLIAVSFIGFTILSTNYVLIVPMAYNLAARYGITDPAKVGLCFLPAGVGNMIGAPLAGMVSDRIVVKWRARRGGVWYPEDRLRACYISAATLVPGSILFSGLIITFVPGRVGLVLNLICIFVNGLGIDMALAPTVAYVVDVLHLRSAEAVAAYTSSRNLMLAVSTATALPMVERIGVAWTDAISAFLSVLGLVVLTFTIKYGDEMRAWIDVGYATAETN